MVLKTHDERDYLISYFPVQASPYVILLFVVPVHYFTHVFLLFFSGVWATNIHDATVIDFNFDTYCHDTEMALFFYIYPMDIKEDLTLTTFVFINTVG